MDIVNTKKDSFIDKSDKIINISDIKRVYLQESEGMKDDEGNISTVYNVQIETKSENISLTPYASGGKEVKAEIVDKMNAFLKNPSQKKVYVEQNDDGLGITIGLIACVIGAVLILFAIIIFVASIFFKTISKI